MSQSVTGSSQDEVVPKTLQGDQLLHAGLSDSVKVA